MMNLYRLSDYLLPRCPYCFKNLVPGELKQYETTYEHVDDPNREYFPPRPTFVCDCELGKYGYWNIQEGAFYVKDYSEFHKKFPRQKSFAHNAAIFSFDWFCEVERLFERRINKAKRFFKPLRRKEMKNEPSR
jgi:hypothetical protein